MKLFKTEKYNGFIISYEVNDDGTFYAYVDGLGSSYKQNKHHETFKEVQKIMRGEIDKFISKVPKNYDELATEITNSLVWTGYEDCYVDETNLKTLVENFIKYRNQ